MKFWLILFLVPFLGKSQEFSASSFPTLRDFNGQVRPDTIRVKVEGVSNLNELRKACITIIHERVSDLKIELLAPNGTSLWLTNRNGRDIGKNYINTCFTNIGFSGYIHQGSAPFTGEFYPDGVFENLTDKGNPNGIWRFVVHDLREGISGTVNQMSLSFDRRDNVSKEDKCSFENPQNCRCTSSKEDCKLLPDLVILPYFTQNQFKEYEWNHYKYTSQIRFAATIANIGEGPMETQGTNEWYCGDRRVEGSLKCQNGEQSRQKLVQRIYKVRSGSLSYDDLPTGTNYYDEKPGHDHFHVDNWVEFRLVKERQKKNGRLKKKTIAKSRKVSYCLFDTGICNSSDNVCEIENVKYSQKNLNNFGLGHFPNCDSGTQGISVGGYDTYGMLYEGQFITIPKRIKNGAYYLEIEVDPERRYYESNRNNNTYRQKIELTKRKK